MSNSPLVVYKNISPHSTKPRKFPITKITPHHAAMVNASLQTLGDIFQRPKKKASATYGIDTEGRIGLFVDEENAPWTSNSEDNDNRAITIEIANTTGEPDWKISDKSLESLIDLCVDICQRRNIRRLNFTGDKTGNLTMHKWFAATKCPGPYLESKFPYIEAEVNKRLEAAESGVLYRVQVGAFRSKANAEALAEKLKAAGFDAYIKEETKEPAAAQEPILQPEPQPEPEPTPEPEPEPEPDPEPIAEPAAIKAGDKVRVREGARTYTGGALAASVYRTVYDVQQISGNRAVIGLGGKVTAAMKLGDLMLQESAAKEGGKEEIEQVNYSMKGGLTLILRKEDIEKIEYIHARQPTESIRSVHARTGADVTINANFFEMSSGKTLGHVTDEGKVISQNMSPFGFAFVDKKWPVFSYANQVKAPDFVGGYPTLLRNGKVDIDTKDPAFSKTSKARRGRTAMGTNGNEIVIRVIPDRDGYPKKTTLELANELQSLGCTDAVNYDGGGSSQFISPWGEYISGRNVDGCICIWLKKSPKQEPKQVPTSTPTFAPAPAKTIKVGSKVRVKTGAKTYDGRRRLASFVYSTIYEVQQVKGDRVVIGLRGQATAAVKLQDLILL